MARAPRRMFSPSRRTREWSDIKVMTEVQAIGTTTILGNVSVGAEAVVQQTIVRIRGQAMAHIVAGAASDSKIVGLGLIIVSTEAFAAGSASIPSPIEDMDESWLWHHLFIFGPTVGVESQGYDMLTTQRVEIDSKSQRKFGTNKVLCFVWDGENHAGTPTGEGIAAIRNLVLT